MNDSSQSILLDPSVRDGGRVYFDKEIPLQVFPEQDQEEPEVIITRMKIILFRNDQELETVRMELTTELDLFFLYEANYNEASFNQLKDEQKLEITFDEFPQLMADILEQYAQNSEEYFVTFKQNNQPSGILLFQQRLRFKSIDIFALEFVPAQDDYVKDQIQYRYNATRADAKAARTELNDLYALLKIKNPNILKTMKPTRK